MRCRQPVVEVGDSPSRLKYQASNFCHLGKINLVHGIRGLVVIHVNTVKIEDHGYAVFGIIPVVGAVVDSLWIIGIVVVVIQLHLLELGVCIFAELVQLLADAVRSH
jgi:hypothetical protein